MIKNRFTNLLIYIMSFLIFHTTYAMAAGDLVLSGVITNKNSGDYVTSAVLKKGSNLNSPEFSDILWIGQTNIEKDGSYRLVIPHSVVASGEEIKSNYQLIDTKYVSQENGSDENDGSAALPYKSLSTALTKATDNSIIVLLDKVAVSKNMIWSTDKSVTITGKNPVTGVVSGGIDLTPTIALRITAPTVFENLEFTTIQTASISENANKLFACGNKLIMGNGLYMTNPIDIFGGNSINNTAQATDLILRSGTYRRIYGGGENSPVIGDTHILIGDINNGYSANDSSSTYYDSRVFGGGKNSGADVGGNTNIDVNNGTIAYAVGGGSGANVSGDININISGGRIMNVYGGTVDKSTVYSGNSFINMTGGTVESLFGGSMSIGFIGNTYIAVTGGDVLRRIYGGCYNDYGWSWGSDYSVDGTTNVTIGKDALLITGGDLSSSNKLNSGIFGGSRTDTNHSEEEGALIFLSDAYEKYSSKIGECSGSFTTDLISHHDFLVSCKEGGTIASRCGRKVEIIPDSGMKAMIAEKSFFGGEYNLTGKETSIIFVGGYTIEKPNAQMSESGALIKSTVSTKDTSGVDGKVFAAVYSADNILLGINSVTLDGNGDYNIYVDFDAKDSVLVKLFILNDKNMAPLCDFCTVSLN